MTNEQLRILLELIKGRVELEIDIVGTELAKCGAKRRLQWYDKETGAKILYSTPGEPIGNKYEPRQTGDLVALTGLRNLVSELRGYSRSLEGPRGEKW